MDKSLSGPGIESPLRTDSPRFREKILSRWLGRIRAGRLTVEFPSGFQQTYGDAEATPQALVRIYDLRVVRRLLLGGELGLAESYMDGDWETPDLAALLSLGISNAETMNGVLNGPLTMRLLNRLRGTRRANTRRGSRRNIAAHYDLGNRFYRLWLDGSMTYSAALFDEMDEPLAIAQRRKYARMARLLDLQPEDRVLEIGCGWGGFAEFAAAEIGCHVVALTLSAEQAAYAERRMAEAGVAGKVDIRMQDYRDVRDRFDKIASIEMFEAVGEENWQAYFDQVRRCLRPGGRAAVQTIVINDRVFEDYRRDLDFVQRYIFPGGILPSPTAFRRAVAGGGMRISDSHCFGDSYAETLRRWDAAFQDKWREVESLGFDRRFRRMWHFYLCYCEVGFESGHIDVGQYLIETA